MIDLTACRLLGSHLSYSTGFGLHAKLFQEVQGIQGYRGTGITSSLIRSVALAEDERQSVPQRRRGASPDGSVEVSECVKFQNIIGAHSLPLPHLV
jgi:hypothetical protein